MLSKKFKESIWSLSPESLDYSSKCTQGHAEFKPGCGVIVEFPFGGIIERVPDENGVIVHAANNNITADAIYGLSQDGYRQTVLNVAEIKSTHDLLSLRSQTVRGSQMYVTKSSNSIHPNPMISCFSLSLSGLREWVGITPAIEETQYDAKTHVVISQTLTFRPGEIPIITLYDKDGMKISLLHKWNAGESKLSQPNFIHRYESDYTLCFDITPERSLEDVLNQWVIPTCKFINFCMGIKTERSNLSFTTTQGDIAEYYVPFSNCSESTNQQLRSMPLPWHKYKDLIPKLFERWVAFDVQTKDASIRLVSLLHSNSLPIDMEFLAAAQAFEAITRTNSEPYEMDPNDYEKRIRDIKEGITDKKLKKWVGFKLKHGNNKSANSLAREQIEALGKYADYIIPDKESFLEEHRDTRNYYSHLDKSRKTKILEPGERMVANKDATILLLYGSVCLKLGMTPDEIIDSIKTSYFMSYPISRIHNEYRLQNS